MTSRKGGVILVVVASLAVLIVVATVIINIGCSEIAHTRAANDLTSASYVATSGAELLYARLKSMEGQTVSWPQALSGSVTTHSSGGTVLGTYNAQAKTVTSNVFGIASTGIVNGKTATVTVTYGFDSPFTSGYPIDSMGDIALTGTRWTKFRSWVRAEGPIAAGGEITTNDFVQISGDQIEDQPFSTPSFWLGAQFDTNNDTYFAVDTNNDGVVTREEAIAQGKEGAFNDDNKYDTDDDEISDKDAFYYYYTWYLNQAANNKLNEDLSIGAGESRHYSGDQEFDPSSVPQSTPIIFVDGNVDILFNDTEWWGANVNHTIIAMGDITIVQPTNGSQDTLTLISYGDVNTGGVRAFGGVVGNFVVYAHGNFNAYFGGRTDGTIFSEEGITVDTVLPIPGMLNRDLNKCKTDWADSANWPLGLPPNYNMVSLSFRIKTESGQTMPIWQRN